MNKLEKRILDISYKKKLSHIGSCITAVNIIDNIYDLMNNEDIFILSSGHAALALYVVLEDRYGLDAEGLFDKHGVHPNRDVENRIYASSGSLGHGLGIALGHAMTDRYRDVYCLVSDGECAEGSIWEALTIADEQKISNLRVFVNANGYGAYKDVNLTKLTNRLQTFIFPRVRVVETTMSTYPLFLHGLQGHYHVLNSDEYNETKNTPDMA